MPSNKKLLQAAAGNAGESLYVEDVFSTYLYDGNGTSQTITNGIDLAGEGGLVWCKPRTIGNPHYLGDTERGINKFLESNATNAEGTSSTTGGNTGDVNAYNADGFSVGSTGRVNQAGQSFASWTFRKAEKFFDVVTYTGNGVDNRQIPHNLGSVPAMIIVKSTSSAGQWPVYHQSLGTGAVRLNLTNAYNSANIWWKTTPTDSHFTVYGGGEVNVSGIEYVAYLFASDAGGFGDDGSENIIKCGSYTGSNGSGKEINLGFEPQWVLVKNTSRAGQNWVIVDNMRQFDNTGYGWLYPNSSAAEASGTGSVYASPTATGFKTYGNNAAFDYLTDSYIYIAIRRPMKTPESGTEVFQSLAYTGDGASTRNFDLDLTLDAYFQACRSSSTYDFKNLTARLTGKGLYTAGTGAEFATNTSLDVQDGLRAIGFENTLNQSGETYIINGFKRATGFFDVVCHTQVGTGTTNILPHNLNATPELIISKTRSSADSWYVWCVYNTQILTGSGIALNSNTATRQTSGNAWFNINSSSFSTILPYTNGVTNISYLFATLAGVSKVGSVAHSGTTNVDCGFSAGARFVLVKRIDSTGDWYVWDSVRGIVSGNDPYLLLNSTAAEVTNTDYIDPLSSGFTLTSSFTAGTYIFLAIAQVT